MIRRAAGVLGELLITAGVIVLLFVVWQIGYLGWVDGNAQADQVQKLERTWEAESGQQAPGTPGSPGTATKATPGAPATPPGDGTAYAILRIPRLGADWAKPIHEGVGLDVLAKGIGHYKGTAQAGEVGNASFAGHRSGHGNPLLDIDRLQKGDAIVVETPSGWAVYRVDETEIVLPTDTSVIAPVPKHPGHQPSSRWLTLTTCNPRWGNSHRYIVFARLTESVPRAQGAPAALQGAS